MNHLAIKILAPNTESPWAALPNLEGETVVEEVVVLEGGMASGKPSIAFKVPTKNGWVFFQMTYGNLKNLAAVVEGVALRTEQPKTPTETPQ